MQEEPQRRSMSLTTMLLLLLLAMMLAVGLAYLVTVHNFPAHHG